MWVHRQVDSARILALEQNLLPVLSPVLGSKHTTLTVGPEGVPQGRDVHQIRILWMDSNPGDVTSILQSKMRPGLAIVVGPVDTVAGGHVAADTGLAHARVDYRRVRLGHRQRPNGGCTNEAVRDIPPVGPAVRRLPNTARNTSEVEGISVTGVTGHGHDSTASERPDISPVHCADSRHGQGTASCM